jgi:succinate dehydrogenase / fumarate reductase iron-sulfur subunit
MDKPIVLRIRRQARPDSEPYWQDFSIPYQTGYNMVSALMAVRDNPVTVDGERVDSPAWEYNCMEEVCGACSMVINGRPRQACSTLIDELRSRHGDNHPITLEPLSKFPLVRDLMVDRSRIFKGLKQVKAWIEIDGAWDVHERAPRISPKEWEESYLFSRCMSCGCCMEACPQFSQNSEFVGPAVLAQVKLKNAHPTGQYNKTDRLHAIMAEGGLSDCGNAQNCVRLCPKNIPLTTAIAGLGREVSAQLLKDILG